MNNIESCIIEIKQAIARIEEQAKTIFKTLDGNREWAEKLHSEHFEAESRIKEREANCSRAFDVRVSKHDGDIEAINKTLSEIEPMLRQIVKASARTKGIAMGLGMAGGA